MTFRKSDRKYRKAEPERKTDQLRKFSVTNSLCSKNIYVKNQLFFGEVGGVLKCLHHPTPPLCKVSFYGCPLKGHPSFTCFGFGRCDVANRGHPIISPHGRNRAKKRQKLGGFGLGHRICPKLLCPETCKTGNIF